MRARRKSSMIVVLLGLLTALGCGSTRSTSVRATGFLDDLSGLHRVDASVDGEVYVSEPNVLRRYRRFLLEPVVVVFAEDSPAQAIEPNDIARLASSLREKVRQQLVDGGYELTNSPERATLRLRAALTDVNPSRPAVNLGGKAAGIALGVGGFVVPTIDLGGAAIEVEMVDAITGQRVAAFRDARKGKRFGGTLVAARKWGHAEEAFDVWARELRARLDQLHNNP